MAWPSEHEIVNLAVAAVGIGAGIVTVMKRLQFRRERVNGSGLSYAALETEVGSVLRRMRSDNEKGFEELREQYREVIRRLRSHDDDLADIKQRISRLEN